jgi:hypothetical protein
MTVPQRFALADILSVSTGRLLSKGAGIHGLIEHLAGHPVWIHQLPRYAGPCALALVDQLPWLADIPEPTHIKTEQDVADWMAPLVARYGAEHDVRPMAPGWVEQRDPIEELVERVGPDRVIPIPVEDGSLGGES